MKTIYHNPPAHDFVDIDRTMKVLRRDLIDLVDTYQEPVELKKQIELYISKGCGRKMQIEWSEGVMRDWHCGQIIKPHLPDGEPAYCKYCKDIGK